MQYSNVNEMPAEAEPSAQPTRERLGAGRVTAIVIAAVVSLVVFAVAMFALLNPQRIADQVAVWQFDRSTVIEAYADRATFTEEGRFLFFASMPTVSPEGEFDRICSSRQEDVGILGCYLPDDQRIFLYDVTDDRLDGLEEVVAAHELLHAVWDRLSQTDRDTLAPLLEAEAVRLRDDEDFAATLAFYARSEPGERLNELHSIVGTEFVDISTELQAHYASYFLDRSAITALHEQSEAIFDQQAAAVTDLTAKIDGLVATVDADSAVYNSGYDQLNADIDAFNARADSGDFDSQAAFTAERNELLARQSTLDVLYDSIDARAAEYDALLAQLEALNAEITRLNTSINISERSQPDL